MKKWKRIVLGIIGGVAITGVCYLHNAMSPDLDGATIRNGPAGNSRQENVAIALLDVLNTDGTMNHTGVNSHTGAETHSGIETHSGAETHSGNEIFDKIGGGTETVTLSSADPGVGTATLTTVWSGIVSDATGSATDTCSLLDGYEGQIKMFTLTTDGETTGTALTPVNFGPGTDILFEDVNDGCTLIFAGSAWQVITNTGGTIR